MQGVEKQAGFCAVSTVAPGLVDEKSVFGFLAAHRGEVFPASSLDDLFADRSRAGHPSIPGPVLMSALVLQALTGVSDRGAAEALTYDLRWKAACGVAVDETSWDPSVFCYFRARIAKSDRPGRVFQAVDAIIAATGVLKTRGRRVVDSTVLDDSVARQDTFKLLVWQIARIGELMPGLDEGIMGLPGGVWYRDRAKPDIDWRSARARDELVSVLVNDAATVAGWAEERIAALPAGDPAREGLADQVGLLGVLAGQDVEPAPGSDGTDGRWRIARRTAPDRVISVVDPQARHIRKTTQNKHDGFKAHMIAEPETGLVTAVAVSSGAGEGSSDAANAKTMLETEPGVVAGQVTQLVGDSAYDTIDLLNTLDERDLEPVVKPRPLPAPTPGGYSLDDFLVDGGQVICPAGHAAAKTAKQRASFARWCHTCPLKDKCTTSKRGRVVVIGDTQLRLREHRRQARDPVFAATLRHHRPMAERTLAWLCRPGRRTPYRGTTKTSAWWTLRAAATNLKRLVSLGLEATPAGWQLALTT